MITPAAARFWRLMVLGIVLTMLSVTVSQPIGTVLLVAGLVAILAA